MFKKSFLAVIAILFACQFQPAFAGDKYAGFDYFFKSTPAQAFQEAALAKAALMSPAIIDSAKKWIEQGVWVFKPNVTVTTTAFDKHGTPWPFSGAGSGVSFQNQINTSKGNSVAFEVSLDWLVFDINDIAGNGPALLVGAYGATVGPAYDVRNKVFYALVDFNLTLWK